MARRGKGTGPVDVQVNKVGELKATGFIGSLVKLSGGLAVAIVVVGIGFASSPAGATAPCAPIQYTVRYLSPLWTIELVYGDFTAVDFWYLDPARGGYVSFEDHVNRTAAAMEPVTLHDRSGPAMTLGADSIEVWDPEGRLTYLRIAWGSSPENLSAWQGFWLQDGYESECWGNPPEALRATPIPILPILVVVGLGGVAAVVLPIILQGRRRGL